MRYSFTSPRVRISKGDFQRGGGLSNTRLFRKGVRGGWSYWRLL